MPIQIDGKTPDTIRVGRPDGTLATIGEARVWDGQWRTIYTSWEARIVVFTPFGTGSWGYTSGDTSLQSSSSTSYVLIFTAPVTCDRAVRNYPAGTVIPAGTDVTMAAGNTAVPHTFTEVRT